MVDLFFYYNHKMSHGWHFFFPTTHNTTAACIKIYGNNIIVLPFVYSNYICLESFRYLVRFLLKNVLWDNPNILYISQFLVLAFLEGTMDWQVGLQLLKNNAIIASDRWIHTNRVTRSMIHVIFLIKYMKNKVTGSDPQISETPFLIVSIVAYSYS